MELLPIPHPTWHTATRMAAAHSQAVLFFCAGQQVLMPGTGLMTLGTAALFGISTVLRTETSDKAFRVNEVL